MRSLLPFLMLFITIEVSGQIAGRYYDRFGNKLELRADSTFSHSWQIDLASSWSQGSWTARNDTVFITIVPVFDTLKTSSKYIGTVDSLVLSADKSSDMISMETYAMNSIASGGQNRERPPLKLYYKRERLYYMDINNQLVSRKVKSFTTRNKVVSWFSTE